MKLLIVCILLLVSLFVEIKSRTASSLPQTSSSKDTIVTDTIYFTTHIQPILVSHCSPCHFTGGKMYERLPFDKDTTILNHSVGILRRIKDEKENVLIKEFVEQQKKEEKNN